MYGPACRHWHAMWAVPLPVAAPRRRLAPPSRPPAAHTSPPPTLLHTPRSRRQDGVYELVRSRWGWLLLFFGGLVLAAVVVEAFEEVLKQHVELSYFGGCLLLGAACSLPRFDAARGCCLLAAALLPPAANLPQAMASACRRSLAACPAPYSRRRPQCRC